MYRCIALVACTSFFLAVGWIQCSDAAVGPPRHLNQTLAHIDSFGEVLSSRSLQVQISRQEQRRRRRQARGMRRNMMGMNNVFVNGIQPNGGTWQYPQSRDWALRNQNRNMMQFTAAAFANALLPNQDVALAVGPANVVQNGYAYVTRDQRPNRGRRGGRRGRGSSKSSGSKSKSTSRSERIRRMRDIIRFYPVPPLPMTRFPTFVPRNFPTPSPTLPRPTQSPSAVPSTQPSKSDQPSVSKQPSNAPSVSNAPSRMR